MALKSSEQARDRGPVDNDPGAGADRAWPDSGTGSGTTSIQRGPDVGGGGDGGGGGGASDSDDDESASDSGDDPRSLALGVGITDCGSLSKERCDASVLVEGGTYKRGTSSLFPATVSRFRLDRYEVTVARFRMFAAAWVGGWRPVEGSGVHAHVSYTDSDGGVGVGLRNAEATRETGWVSAWNAEVPATVAEWDRVLGCDATAASWSPRPMVESEKEPQNCVTWFDVYAFCIWDGGFLPSEAEWEFVAAGGAEERLYPWGTALPSNATATFNRTSPIDVGARPTGAGRWGHLDLAGNVAEWVLDSRGTYSHSCVDCINGEATESTVVSRSYRGGTFSDSMTLLSVDQRRDASPRTRSARIGMRCARTP